MQAGVVVATIAHAGAIGNQGWSSNLQRFEAHYPSALKGEGDPIVAGRCFRLVKKDTGAVVAIIAHATAVAANITRTSATVGQGGMSNL